MQEMPSPSMPQSGNGEGRAKGISLQWTVVAAGGVAMLIGGFMLAAWLSGAATRWSADGNTITVKTNMALGLVLAGIALILLGRRWQRPMWRWVGLAAAVVVFLLGTLTLSEHLSGRDLGIDQLLAKELPGARATASPNRMGVPGSGSHALLGIALLLLGVGGRGRRLAPYLGLGIILIDLIFGVGFLYGIDKFFTLPTTGIAWPTVLAMLCLGLGLVVACPESGPMAMLLCDDAGGKLLRGMVPVAVLLPLTLGFLSALAQGRGHFDIAMGTGLLVLSIIVIFSIILWRNAVQLSRVDYWQKQAQQAVRESEGRLRLFIEHAPAALAMFDREMRYISASRRWLSDYGLEGRDVMGQSHYQVFPEIPQRWREFHRRGLAGEVVGMAEDPFERADGSTQWVRWEIRPWRDGDGQVAGIVIFAEDITQRKRSEDLAQAMERVSVLIHSTLHFNSAMDRVMAEAVSTIGVDTAALSQRCDGGWIVSHVHGLPKKVIGSRMSDEEEPHALLAIQTRSAVVVDDAFNDPRVNCVHMREWGVRSVLVVPLVTEDQVIGVLFFNRHRQAAAFGKTEVDFAGRVASMMALGITKARLLESAEAVRQSAEQARDVAEAASKAKDDFIAVLSHELRNPLNPVLATVAMLEKETGLDADTRAHIEVIHRNAELEARLIDDLLDVTRIERGKVELSCEPVELCTIVGQAAEVCRPDIESRKLEFGIDFGPAPYWVEADPARLQQVFWNLIKNSVKFTTPGGCVGIRCRRESDDTVVVEVNDSGEGIDPELLPRLFCAFEQGERPKSRQFGGLGLGLTISKALVELHGGTIAAYSEGKGKGATFAVRLPLLRSEAKAVAPAPAVSPVTAARALHILLVEDHGDSARIMCRLLSANGHDVEVANDVATALNLAGSQRFDLLLSDLGLPDGSGLDLMRTLRLKGSRLPGIALSGYGQQQDLQQSRAAGFAVHLVKPVNMRRLEDAISEVAGTSHI